MKKYILFIISVIINSGYATQFLNSDYPEARSAPPGLRKIQEVRTVKSLTKPAAGDTTFFLRSDIFASLIDLEEVSFYKKAENDTLVVYVETTEFDEGRVSQDDVNNVVNSMLYSTPGGSIDPGRGIYANEIDIFGKAPDVDNNGKLFVLLIDVRDGYEEGNETYVAGYFDPLDQSSNKGNFSDIIYIDTNPANVNDNFTLGVVAHELQHLIHHNYDKDEKEWLNEGLSELAPRILGFPVRSFATFLQDTNRPLNNFDDSVTDYSKVGLWTFYVYKRFGLDLIKEVVRETSNDLYSYEAALKNIGFTDISKEKLLEDWFTANLLNAPDLVDGEYGYGGIVIPEVSSSHFLPNFTGGELVEIELKPASAEYIQFYSGRDISFNINYDTNIFFKLLVIKHYDTGAEIEMINSGSGQYSISDPTYGVDYPKLSIIPCWTSLQSGTNTLNVRYSATGIGGVEEEVLSHDGDSISFYLNIQNYEAGEKFVLPSNEYQLAGIKFNVDHEEPVTIRVYTSIKNSPIAVYNNITPNAQSWTQFTFDDLILPESATSFLLSLSSSSLQLGYSATGVGQGKAYLKLGAGNFQDLSNFSTEGGGLLSGNWLIRAVLYKSVVYPAELILEPDSIYLWNDEYSGNFDIINGGTEELSWNIIDDYPVWLDFDKTEGKITLLRQPVTFSIDRNLIAPGIRNLSIPIMSNGGNDSLFISVLERNKIQPQADFIPSSKYFTQNMLRMTLKLFNIGIGGSAYSFHNLPQFFAIDPMSGFIPEEDTVFVSTYINRNIISQKDINFLFYNGVDTLQKSLYYQGELQDTVIQLKLFPTIPNPFVTSVYNSINIPVQLGKNRKTTLYIYNILGQQIIDFNFSDFHKGIHLFSWDGKNSRSQNVSSGVYLVVLKQGEKIRSQRMLLIR